MERDEEELEIIDLFTDFEIGKNGIIEKEMENSSIREFKTLTFISYSSKEKIII